MKPTILISFSRSCPYHREATHAGCEICSALSALRQNAETLKQEVNRLRQKIDAVKSDLRNPRGNLTIADFLSLERKKARKKVLEEEIRPQIYTLLQSPAFDETLYRAVFSLLRRAHWRDVDPGWREDQVVAAKAVRALTIEQRKSLVDDLMRRMEKAETMRTLEGMKRLLRGKLPVKMGVAHGIRSAILGTLSRFSKEGSLIEESLIEELL